MVLLSQEFREQADQCIDRAGATRSALERKLYLRLALTWLEIDIRTEPRTIDPRDTDPATLAALNLSVEHAARTTQAYVEWLALALAFLAGVGVGALIYFFPLAQFLETFTE
jgi:hypothetical protein